MSGPRLLTDPRQLDRMTLADLRHAYRSAEQRLARESDPHRRDVLTSWVGHLDRAIQARLRAERRAPKPPARTYDRPLAERLADAKRALTGEANQTARDRAREIRRQIGPRPGGRR